jgi:hypothetical protein
MTTDAKGTQEITGAMSATMTTNQQTEEVTTLIH